MQTDYRIPQMLHTLGCLLYSPVLERDIRKHVDLPPGSTYEVELRGCSIWCVELIRREILKLDPGANVNAILIDFFLYDTMKKIDAHGTGQEGVEAISHHRTRSIWY